MKKIVYLTQRFLKAPFIFLIMTVFISSCHRDSSDANCPGTVTATWKVDGVAYESYVYVYTHVGTVSNFTLTACVSDANDKIVQLGFIPYPPVVGSYPLKWDNTTGVWNGFGVGQYITDNDGTYFTDSVNYTGSFDIALVNTTNKTITGAFHFSAHEHGTIRAVDITDGIFTSMKYE